VVARGREESGVTKPVKAKPDQVESIFDLWISAKDAFGLAEKYSTPSYKSDCINWLREECVAGRVWIVMLENSITGLAIMHFSKPEIWYLVVKDSYRRSGIGLSILRHLQGIFSKLEAETRTPEARKLFEKCCFVHENGYSAKSHPILIWKKECQTPAAST
jgi:ribosomal protein S18 acetylase RimI-like enzyme